MTTEELTMKYGINSALLSKWIKDGHVRCRQNGCRTLRDYDDRTEEDLKKLVILRAMGIQEREFGKYMNLLDDLSGLKDSTFYKIFMNKIDTKRRQTMRQYDLAKLYLDEFLG